MVKFNLSSKNMQLEPTRPYKILLNLFWANLLKRVKILTNTNLVASRHIIKETAIVPVDVRRTKTSQLLMLPNASTIFFADCRSARLPD